MTETDLLNSIVMPAYNEEGVIAETVTGLCEVLDGSGLRYELIIVDDASTDATPEIIERLSEHASVRGIRNPGPNGYGNAIRKGLDVYEGAAVTVVTSDGSDAPEDVAAYFRGIAEGYDCVFGSRFDGRATVEGYPPVKRVINRIANTVTGWLVGSSYRDFTNGFKCYRRHVIDEMQPIASGHFNITIEMSVSAVLAGHRFKVIPTDWRQRDAGQSSFVVARLFRPYLATLLYCLCRNYLRRMGR